jgi:glycolate oxidase iron-sulfur subunit
MIAAGNIGCAVRIGARSRLPVIHTVELLDWATGGPQPVNRPFAKSAMGPMPISY